jgi:hypothetical protein
MVREVSYISDGDLRHGNVPMMPPQNMTAPIERSGPFNNPDHNVIVLNNSKPSKKRIDTFSFRHFSKGTVAPEYTIQFDNDEEENLRHYKEFKTKVMKDISYY